MTAFRYAVLYNLVFFTSVLALFLTIYWSIGKSLQDNMAKGIKAQSIALSGAQAAGRLSDVIRGVNELSATSGGERVYLLLDRTGRKVAGNLPPMPTRNGWQHLMVAANVPGAPLRDSADNETAPHEVLALGVTLPDGHFLLVGDDTDKISDAEEATIVAFLWALVPAFVLGCFGGAFLSLSYLKRIDAITQTSREIMLGNLSRRISVRGTDDELDRLSSNLNDMFERIEVLMESLKQVSADIAHDLRTPLSHLRQRLETVRQAPVTEGAYESAIDHAIVQVDEILATFAALIRIAQIESGSRRAAFAEQNLSDIFTHVASAYASVMAERGQTLVTEIAKGIGFVGDRSLLVQMLSNLLENAVQHAPKDAGVDVSLTVVGSDIVGIVADSGPGIPELEHQNVLKRFYRLDRSRSTPGNGLGLALVSAVAALHDIAIKFSDNNPGLRVTLKFPRT